MLVPYPKIVPYSALYIDMTYNYLAKAMWQFVLPGDREQLIKQIERVCISDPKREKLLVSACVRTSTDLLFQALNWPPGTELIMTGVNIPHMVQIVRYRGLIPVPVQIYRESLAPKLDEIKKAVTSKTKGIMISYIYGAKYDATEIIEWCHSQGLMILEDCAESFDNPQLKSHPLVDFSTYSFGTIKTCSAFGGSVSIIRNNETIYRKMVAVQETYPMLSKFFFFKRIVKNLIPMVILNHAKMNQISRYLMINYLRFDYKEVVVNSIRGFAVQENFLETFHIQIPTPMLAMLALRMTTFDQKQFDEATKRQLVGQQILSDNGIQVPGSECEKRRFWLFPIIVPNPELTYKMLNARGVDAYMGVTQLDIVESPMGSKYEYPSQTLDYFKKLIYLPLHQQVPIDQVKKICKEVIDVVSVIERMQVKPKL